MTGLIDTIKARAARKARSAAIGTLGMIMILVGVGFLTSAGWIVLTELRTPLFAALIIGGVYLGLGLICVGVVSAGQADTSVPPADTDVPSAGRAGKNAAALPPLVDAFLFGLNAGLAADRRKKDPNRSL